MHYLVSLSMASATFLLFVSSIQPSTGAAVNYAACKAHKAVCFGLPESCITTGDCQVLFQSDYDNITGFHLRLIGQSVPEKRYIAFGFSNITGMSGLVTQCVRSAERTELQFSFNGFAKGQHRHTAIPHAKSVTGFTDLRASFQDGQLECEWGASPTAIIGFNGTEFDITNRPFYFTLSTGPYDPATNQIHYHGNTRLASSTSSKLHI